MDHLPSTSLRRVRARRHKFEAQWKSRWSKRSVIKMNLWQSETLTVTNCNLMVVNRGFASNWQNEAHQSHRRGMLHRQYPVRVTHCWGSSMTRVSGTESCRGCLPLPLTLLRLCFPPHVALSRRLCNSFWQALFFPVAFQKWIGWHSLPVMAETELSKHTVEFQLLEDILCWGHVLGGLHTLSLFKQKRKYW